MLRHQFLSKRLLLLIAVLLACALDSFATDSRAESPHAHSGNVVISSGRQIFEANCATCHGRDGRGAKPSDTGLDIPLPDFTDCAFTSRETVHDWVGIAQRGGPVRAFDEQMPAFGELLTEQELESAIRHIKQFCTNEAWPQGELNFARAILTEKAFPENEMLLISYVNLQGPIEVAGKLIYEHRLGSRSQFELIAPFGVQRRPNAEINGTHVGRWGKGLGDLALGLKHVVFHDVSSGTIISLAGELAIPTGNAADGFGNRTFFFEPFVAAGQQLSDLGFIQLQAGIAFPFDESLASKEAYGRLAIGRSFSQGKFGRMWTPMIEIQAVHEMGDASLTQWDYVPEIQVSLSKRKHVRANLGVSIPMNDLDARPLQAVGYLLWDWFDGGLDEGW